MTMDQEEVRKFIKTNVSGLVKLVENEAADASTKSFHAKDVIKWMALLSSTCAKCTPT